MLHSSAPTDSWSQEETTKHPQIEPRACGTRAKPREHLAECLYRQMRKGDPEAKISHLALEDHVPMWGLKTEGDVHRTSNSDREDGHPSGSSAGSVGSPWAVFDLPSAQEAGFPTTFPSTRLKKPSPAV